MLRKAIATTKAETIRALWCEWMHGAPMWPIHGQYRCRACGRAYRVPWAAVLPAALLAVIVLAAPLHAAGDPAAAALERYTAAQRQAQPWTLETVDIDASLPKLAKTGRLRAIRRLIPAGRPEYQVLETTGDRTVKQQVIIRYLSQDARAATMPSSDFAINAENYKFRYSGVTRLGDSTAYIFQITPRHKREGLIRGELWLDQNGVALRQSGYLVKRPSFFVKRVDVTREASVRDGVVAMRTTHVSLDTRLVGRAELTIEERPAEEER